MCGYAAGDLAFQQVEVDMFRMAALFVMERSKAQLMDYLVAVLSAAQLPQPCALDAQSACVCINLGLTRMPGNSSLRMCCY